MRNELRSASDSARPMLVRHRFANTVITTTRRTHALRMGTTALRISRVVFLSVPVRGSGATTDVQNSMAGISAGASLTNTVAILTNTGGALMTTAAGLMTADVVSRDAAMAATSTDAISAEMIFTGNISTEITLAAEETFMAEGGPTMEVVPVAMGIARVRSVAGWNPRLQ